ncbi:hypothetical protein JOB18_028292 [Solea senegalensis]|uniref:Uncharacterized protein n=1 Tax=Solea senegalensis TaxID=28829 RepID=A0AAV6PRY9_SOLSE|nr:hypothetical protein JOB18_028292 [Solea senegalensis]KAG7475260.1 hypothetical protein JOB18_028292 [Solea senegalensis]KAG7475261.1 hypothetical protein JOB18_028292 [Solea senegalensis]KAG7475262.1 hypothetical protein JOB18_028292 [Solea senegalensis]KAG7475263.1 hypothetical protein JOB18_028292 [Solea senegalensis]
MRACSSRLKRAGIVRFLSDFALRPFPVHTSVTYNSATMSNQLFAAMQVIKAVLNMLEITTL